MKIHTKKLHDEKLRIAITLIGTLTALTLAGCDNPANTDGNPSQDAPQTAVYTSEDNGGNRYTLRACLNCRFLRSIDRKNPDFRALLEPAR
jgi:hypothetical protein